jgi:hypothetical protein
MTEREIQLLGFKINHDDGSGYFDKYHFYTYKVANGLSFISNASDEIKEGGEWFVEVFNTEPVIRFTKFEEVQALINNLETHKIKQHE